MSLQRIGVVGAGNHATLRIYPYIGTAGAKLVGVCDLDTDKAERNAVRFGGNVYGDMREMIEAEKPDAVIVCVGPTKHAVMAQTAMKMGIPVYTEKPPAISSEEAYKTAQVSKETGLLCTTAFKKRYNAAYSRAKEWIDSFDSADLFSISIDYASGQYANETVETLFLLDFAIHIIDLVGYLFGDAEEVFAFTKGRDAYAVSIKFANGAVGSLNVNDGRSFIVPTEEVEISVKGGNFMTIHNSSCWRMTEKDKPSEWREPPTFRNAGDSGYDTGHLAEIEDFLAALKEGRTTRSNIYESYKSMLLYEAIKESAETTKKIKVQYKTL
jgi:predicted dehydrogenase